MKKILLASVFLFFSIGISAHMSDEKDFTILNQSQIIEFFVKDDKLQAKLTVNQRVRANSKAGSVYRKILYFDNESKIERIKFNGITFPTVISNDLPYDGIFHSDSKVAYAEYIFTGKKIDLEVEYSKVFLNYKFIDILRFNESNYEVLNSVFEIKVPDWLSIDLREFNLSGAVTKTKVQEGVIYNLKNIQAKDDISGMPDFRKCEPHIVLVFKSLTHKGKQVKLMPETKDLYEWYAGLASQIGNDQSSIMKLTQDLIKDKSDPLEKIKAINYYVQDNIKYIAFEHGIMAFKPESCQNVFNNKFGDCKGMANLVKEMLKIAGFDARLTWLGTSDVPYDYTLPSVFVDNHMICTVLLDGKYIFLDPTEKLADIDVYAERIQGKEVMIEDGENFIIAKVPIKDNVKDLFKTFLSVGLDNLNLVGKGEVILMGNSKTLVANVINSNKKSDKAELLESFASFGDKNIQSKLIGNPILERDKDFKFDFDIKVQNQIIEAGSDLYISLDYLSPFGDLKLKENRTCSYEFSSKKYLEYNAELTLPNNYKVSYLPENIKESNQFGTFEISYVQDGDKITYLRKTYVKVSEITLDEVNEWNSLVEKLKSSYENRIIVEKE